jgi:hypothetical protein
MLDRPPNPTRPAPLVTCHSCGRPFLQRSQRAQHFCSPRCRLIAHRRTQHETNGPGGVVAAPLQKTAVRPRAISETPRKPNSFQHAKPGGPITGPPDVIAAEMFAGRTWREAVSPDGVVCHVSRMRPRGLVS